CLMIYTQRRYDLICQIITDLKYFNKMSHSTDPNAIQPTYFVFGIFKKHKRNEGYLMGIIPKHRT
ncbi:MAG TPA: hypothetical protein VEQ18_01085, partial [Candidatus Nitrosocosmicus sp.]|nr:hypothetical protein [Candidatus Nitrosocosmicus sp.]